MTRKKAEITGGSLPLVDFQVALNIEWAKRSFPIEVAYVALSERGVATAVVEWFRWAVGQTDPSDREDFNAFIRDVVVPRALEIARDDEGFYDLVVSTMRQLIDTLCVRLVDEIRSKGKHSTQRRNELLAESEAANGRERRRWVGVKESGGRERKYEPNAVTCSRIAAAVETIHPVFKRAASKLRSGDVVEWRESINREAAKIGGDLGAAMALVAAVTTSNRSHGCQPMQLALRTAAEYVGMSDLNLRTFRSFYDRGLQNRTTLPKSRS